MLKSPKPLLKNIISEISKDIRLPFWISLTIYLLSNLQLTFLTLEPTVNSGYDIRLKVFKVILKIASYTVGFDITDPPESQLLMKITWSFLLFYLFMLLGLLIYALVHRYRNKKLNAEIETILSLLYFLHPKIIFCPIHYFLVWICSEYMNCNDNSELIQCNPAFLGVTMTMIFLNFLMAFSKELFAYETKKAKDVFATKNRTYFRLLLLQKATIIILFIVIKDQKLISFIFNFIFPLFCCSSILMTFPFYNLIVLRISLIYTTCHLTLAFFLLITAIGVPQRYLEVMIVISGTLLVKTALSYMNKCFDRILRLELRTPYEAAHIPVLIKNYTVNYSTVLPQAENYKEGSLQFYGVLKLHNVDGNNSRAYQTISDYNYQLYTVVMNRLTELQKVYPKSEILVLLMAQIYIKKLRNPAKAITLLTQFQLGGTSTAARDSIKSLYYKLERIYSKSNFDEDMELLEYFKHRDTANEMRENIQEEISKHLRVWKEISSDTINVKLIVDLCVEIEDLYNRTQKMWNGPIKNLDKSFLGPLLVYGAYLEIVRKNINAGRQVINKYDDMRRNRNHFIKETNPFHENTAVLLGSIEIENAGVIVDSSNSVHNLFNITRERLIGQKVDMLLPRIVAKKHDEFIKRYNKQSKRDLHRNLMTYVKTIDGHILPVKIKLKIYPYINKGLSIIAHVKKVRDRELILTLDKKDMIVDCSEDLFEIFNLNKKDLEVVSGLEICPELKEVTNAIQFLHGVGGDFDHLYSNESKSMTYDGKPDEIETKIKSNNFQKMDLSWKDSNLIEKDTETLLPINTQLMSSVPDAKDFSFADKSVILKKLFTHQSPGLMSTLSHKQTLGNWHNVIKQAAEDTCKKFKKGMKLDFFPKKKVLEHLEMAKDRVEFKVTVEPYLLDGELYKIVKFKFIYMEDNLNLQEGGSLPLAAEFRAQSEASQDEFADKFPAANERTMVSIANCVVEEKKIVLKETKQHAKLENVQKILIENGDQNSVDRTATKEGATPQGLLQKLPAKNGNNADETSSLNYSHKETRIAKALNDLFQRATLRPITKLAVFIVYLAMFIVIFLVGLNYIFSSKSFGELKDGVMIVNTASYKILYALQAWQWTLIAYARSVQLRPLSTVVAYAQGKLYTSNLQMIASNKQLQDKLEMSQNLEIINLFYENSLSLWLPYKNRTFNNGQINGFAATNVISQKNLFVANYSQSILKLNNHEDVLFLLNNTCNDFLVRSEEQVQKTEQIVDAIIQTNQTLVLAIVFMEMVALVFVVFSLLLVVRVIINSYKKLFRVLARIHQENITHRVAELTNIKECFNKNIEGKDFSVVVEGYSELTVKKKKKIVKPKMNSRYREDRFVIREFTVFALKPLIVALLLVAVNAAAFLGSYLTSDSTFRSLELINDRLSIAHRLGYTFDMILGSYYYAITFQNRTEFLIRFKNPSKELDASLEFLSSANERLLSVLPEPEEGITDPVLQDFLRTNLCRFLDASLLSQCEIVTRGKALGLLGLNSKYYQNTIYWVNQFRSNPTFSYASQILVSYSSDISSDIGIIPDAYQFLRSYLLNDFNNRLQDQKFEGLVLFIVMMSCLVATTVIIQLIIIQKFKRIDVNLKKILKIVPFNIIQENRPFGFYLKNEFKKELDSIKQFV